MGLNVAGGEMYPWADYTWNPLGGKCPHDCSYCYMKEPPACWTEKYEGSQELWKREMTTKLSDLQVNRRESLFFVSEDIPLIFVCSGNDLGAASNGAKGKILEKCNEEPSNFYLIQSKNPIGLKPVEEKFPQNTIIGTTLETNRDELCKKISNAPVPSERASSINKFDRFYKMVSIEPIMDFDVAPFTDLIEQVCPDFVSIGADSKGHKLPEPDDGKILDLVENVKNFTTVKKKSNLNRLLKKNAPLRKKQSN